MRAQTLYDMRDQTAFISGKELSELFDRLTGDMSPQGDRYLPYGDLKNELMAMAEDVAIAAAFDFYAEVAFKHVDGDTYHGLYAPFWYKLLKECAMSHTHDLKQFSEEWLNTREWYIRTRML